MSFAQHVPITLSLTGDQHRATRTALFPGDGREAAAIVLCGRRAGERRHRLLVQEIHAVPHEAYTERTATRMTWSTDLLASLLEKASRERLSVVKIHSHPTGNPAFSHLDDTGDTTLLPAIRDWMDTEVPHGSVIMLPDGQMFGRVLVDDVFVPFTCINVVGDDLHFWYADRGKEQIPDFAASHAQIFGEGTMQRLQRLSIGVVGCSGTGSPVIEQLVRYGAGEVVLVDDDRLEERNVNRILNSTLEDARLRRSKVAMLAEAIARIGLGTKVRAIAKNLWNPEVIREIAQCDVLFGCVDTIDGRFLLNSIAAHYTLPYFDLGVRLDAIPEGSEKGKIREVCGSIHFLQPGRSSLMSRGLFTLEQVAAAGLRRTDPLAYDEQADAGYISGVQEQRPAVISVNMNFAALGVHELLARLHPYRQEPNSHFAHIEFSFSSMEIFPAPEEGSCGILQKAVGKGDMEPLLGLVELAERSAS